MAEYPDLAEAIPAVQSLIDRIASGRLRENRAELASDLWIVQGYAFSQVFGEASHPMAVSLATGEETIPSDEQARMELEKFADPDFDLDDAEEIGAMGSSAEPDWSAVLRWVFAVLPHLYR